jgi:CRISPR-associated protein Cas5/CasD subtype I-E
MLRSALGDGRVGDVALAQELDHLEITVRTDRAGTLLRDYHTITANPPVAKLGNGDFRKGTIISERWYLSDAAFLVAIEDPRGGDLLERVQAAVESPVWHLALGRRSCAPAFPFSLGVVPLSATQVVSEAPAMNAEAKQLLVSVEQSRRERCEGLGWAHRSSASTMTRPVGGHDRVWSPETRSQFTLPHNSRPADAIQLARWARKQGAS